MQRPVDRAANEARPSWFVNRPLIGVGLGVFAMASVPWSGAGAQILSEQLLGTINVPIQVLAASPVISPRGNNVALLERVDAKRRYVTLQGPGPLFDRILSNAAWIKDRLVYFASDNGKYFLVDGAKRQKLAGTPTSPATVARFVSSPDRSRYVPFVSDAKSIGWYADGALQATRFDRLVNITPTKSPVARPVFFAVKDCLIRAVGHTGSAKGRWDQVTWAQATADGSVMFVYGERAGLPVLHRNGVLVLKEGVGAFAMSRDGKRWFATVDRSKLDDQRTVLLQGGKLIAEAAVPLSHQTLYVADDGSTWVWSIRDDNGLATTLRQPGKPDRRLPVEPLEFHLSDDGRREAYAVSTDETPPRARFVLDGTELAVQPGITHGSFRFGPGSAFAFRAKSTDAATKWIVSHLGEGPKFDDVSHVLFLPDGRPVYAALSGADKFIVVGITPIKIPADDLRDFETLRVEGSTVKVMGKRDRVTGEQDILAFSIQN